MGKANQKIFNEMTDQSYILQEVMKDYIDDDEDFAKEIMFENSIITFKVFMIDGFLNVKAKLLGSDTYEVKYGAVNKQERNPSFKRFLKVLLDDLMKERKKKIQFYDSLNTPCGEPKDLVEGDVKDSEDEDEGEDNIDVATVTRGGIDSRQDLTKISSDLSNPKILNESLYTILTYEQLIEVERKSVEKVSETMLVSEAGAKVREAPNPDEEYECPSCYDDLPYSDTFLFDACGHRFCNECWKEHLTVKIKDGLSKRIVCMGAGCPCAVDESVVSQYITDPKVKKRYYTKVLETFVRNNDSMKWCPCEPHCGSAVQVRVSPKTPLSIICGCGKRFCFSCLEEAHNPCSCTMFKTWKNKSTEDSNESLESIPSNTRNCPKCDITWQKYGGSNHMTCTCGSSWCWSCGGIFDMFDYSTVYSHNCNQFLEKEGGRRKSWNPQRYLHYLNRFTAHKTSVEKMENGTYRRIKQSPEWVKKGLNVLFDVRNALMFSYVLAYFIFDRPPEEKKKNILKGCKTFSNATVRSRVKSMFEYIQAKLENSTEEMNNILEMPLSQLLKEDIKMRIMKYGILNERRLHALFNHIREEMVLNEIYRLPNPRFICTQPPHQMQQKPLQGRKVVSSPSGGIDD